MGHVNTIAPLLSATRTLEGPGVRDESAHPDTTCPEPKEAGGWGPHSEQPSGSSESSWPRLRIPGGSPLGHTEEALVGGSGFSSAEEDCAC